jgi:DNA primase
MSNIIDLLKSEGYEPKKFGDVYKIRCPFHEPDDEPSLAIYPETQTFYCFGCHATGDAIDFLQMVNDQNFIRTFQMLRDQARAENGGEISGPEFKEIEDACQSYVFLGQYYAALRRMHPRKIKKKNKHPETDDVKVKYAKISIE